MARALDQPRPRGLATLTATSTLPLLGLILTALLCASCLDESQPGIPPQPDRGVIPPDSATPDAGLAVPMLELGSIPNATCGDEVGVIGRATPGVTIIVRGGSSASGVIGDTNPTTGRFCVPTKLRPGQLNNLQVVAHDPNLGFSKPAMVAVKQEDCSGSGEFKDGGVGDAGVSRNVALGMQAKSKETPEKGNHGFLTDGDTSTWVMWKGSANWYCGWCDYGGWAMLTLEQLYEVERVVVRWRDSAGNGRDYGKEYKLLFTAVTDPPDPNLDDGFWTVAKSITEGNGGTDTFDLKSIGYPLIKHVALWFQQDERPFINESGIMGTVDESFAVAEIEVYDKPKSGSGPPPPPPNVCQGF
jgi:hypothetical protein